MSETKRGLFGRLFGRSAEPAPVVVAEPVVEAPVAAPEAEVEAPAAVTIADEVAAEPAAVAEPVPAEIAVVAEMPAAEAEPIDAPEPVVDAEPVEDDEPEPEPEPVAVEPVPTGEAAARPSWWQKLKSGLSRTSTALGSGIGAIFTKRKLDDATLDELEDILIQADLGLATATRITAVLKHERYDREISDGEVRAVLAREVEKVLAPIAVPLALAPVESGPRVVLVVGVNGSGKTTTIGKLAMRLSREGKSVVLAAGDTFRAAAIEQLKIWGARSGAEVIAREPGADAAGLAFDALAAAKASRADVLVIDTAGRLQNRTELMAELEKVVRVLKKQDPTAPHDVILTLDATTGQNALNQVEIFGRVAGVTGLVMTKLDGTARGGILVAIAEKFSLPVHFIGVGEGIDDLEPFDAGDFARAIAGLDRG
jgi:fused signal recognition particle receptor